jgi:chromosome segregation ATPase
MSDEQSDRLREIQSELETILDQRLGELAKTLRATESTTRKIVGAEIDIERHNATRERLESEFDGLMTHLTSARDEADKVRKRHDGLISERDELAGELQRMETSVKDAALASARTRTQVEELEAEAETLRTENAALKTKLKTLEENISRMRRLKEELMSSISGLTAQMTGLAGGNK